MEKENVPSKRGISTFRSEPGPRVPKEQQLHTLVYITENQRDRSSVVPLATLTRNDDVPISGSSKGKCLR